MFKTLAVGLGAAALLTQCAPTIGCTPAAPAAATTSVTRVIDGDTVEIPGDTIRIIGIDTPEQGTCGFDAAKARMTQLVQGQTVSIPGGARDDRDSTQSDRLLRYVDTGSYDAGLVMIQEGLAVARYDSRDGYGTHPREAAYVAADAASRDRCPQPGPATGEPYKNCTAVRAAGAAPIYPGQPGWGEHLDGNHDGVGCE